VSDARSSGRETPLRSGASVSYLTKAVNALTPCWSCRAATPRAARFCGACGAALPQPNLEFRGRLFESLLELSSSADLSDWLRELGRNVTGTVEDKRRRIWTHAPYLSTPALDFPDATLKQLRMLRSVDDVAAVCEALELEDHGSRADLVRRILRLVRVAEGWMPPLSAPTLDAVRLATTFYPLMARGNERDVCEEFKTEASEMWPSLVYPQYGVAHGTVLRIDFHIGPVGGPGVGVEFKVPKSNADLQRAMGQLDQYLVAYPDRRLLLVVVKDQRLPVATLKRFETDVRGRGVSIVIKERCRPPT
jgi:hypothetical protein